MKSKPWLPYVVPMGIYMGFLFAQTDANLLWMYPLKTLAVAAALIYFRKQYVELRSGMWCSGASVKRRDDGTTCASQKRSYNAASGDAAYNGTETTAGGAP